MSDQTLIEAFARNEFKKWNLTGWRFEWGNAKRTAGTCYHNKKLIRMSLPLLKAMGLYDAIDTLLHEVAHALAGYRAGHGPEWKRWAKKVGAKPKRCFDLTREIQNKMDHKYHAICPNCNHKTVFNRRWKYNRSCGKCSGGSYNPEYKLQIVQNY